MTSKYIKQEIIELITKIILKIFTFIFIFLFIISSIKITNIDELD